MKHFNKENVDFEGFRTFCSFFLLTVAFNYFEISSYA